MEVMKVKKGFKVTMFNMEVWVDGGSIVHWTRKKSESGFRLIHKKAINLITICFLLIKSSGFESERMHQ